MQLTIDGNLVSVTDEFRGRLNPRRLRQYLSTAVNDTSRQVRTRTIQEVVRGSSLPRVKVAGGVAVNPYSNPETLSSTVRGSGRPIALKYFSPRQTDRGVVATVWGKAQFYPHAFIVASLSGNVFTRDGSPRLPIHKMYGAGIAQVMAESEVAAVLLTYGRERLAINVARQIDRAVAGAGGVSRG